MLFTDYQKTFTTAFEEFNLRLFKAKTDLVDYDILKDEAILLDFVSGIFSLRKVYNKLYESDIHTDFLQPKVEIIYDLIQDKIEDIRNRDAKTIYEIDKLISEMIKYVQPFNDLLN